MRKTQIADILKPEYDKLYLLKFNENEIKMEGDTTLLLLSKKAQAQLPDHFS